MPRATKKPTTTRRATPKPAPKARKTVSARTIETMRFADPLNSLVGRLEIVGLAIEGAIAASDADVLSPVVTFLGDVRAEITAVSRNIHPEKRVEVVA